MKPGIGDTVEDGDQRAVVTDINSGQYILRPEAMTLSVEWPAEDPDRLVVVRSREQADTKHSPAATGPRAVPDDSKRPLR